MPLPKPTIDLLPEAQRQQIVDALLSGRTVRQVAALVGISFQQVAAYRRKHLYPAMHTAVRALRESGQDVRGQSGVCQAVDLTKSLTKASPFLDRLEYLWEKSRHAVERAESAVRVVTDPKTGQLAVVGPDVTAIAPALNQAHKNCELLGRVTGELETAAAPKIAIQIVLPSAANAQIATSAGGEMPAIDIGVTRR